MIIGVNYRGIRYSTVLQNLTTLGLLAVFAMFTVLGPSHGRAEQLPPYFADTLARRGRAPPGDQRFPRPGYPLAGGRLATLASFNLSGKERILWF